MKILVVLFQTLGDVCMGTTVVHALKEKYPDSTIDFVTKPASKNILEGNPDINEIIIKDNYYDVNLLYLEGGYDEICRLSMANVYDTCWHHVPEHQNQHLVEWYAKRAGIDELPDKTIYINLTEDDVADVDDYWEDLDQEKKYVAIHTTSGAHHGVGSIESKDWPVNDFKDLAKKLIDDGYGVLQIGAFSDKKMVMEGVVDMTGKLSFKQNAELFKRCVGYIGVDSGPAYLSGWAGIPTVLIMGATQNLGMGNGPNVGPREDNVHYINAPKPNDPKCSPVPCYIRCQLPNKGIGCIVDITVDDVYKRFKEVVK